MFELVNQLFFCCYIKVLRAFKPAMLFHQINQLGWYQQTLRRWVDDQNFATQSHLLEIGCATGSVSRYLSANACKVTAVDHSPAMIAEAKSLAGRASVEGVSFQVADALCLPFEEHQFDAVFAASLLNIIQDKQQAVNEMMRVCKPGGIVSVLVPASSFAEEDLNPLVETLGLSGFSKAALIAWHRLAPKIQVEQVEQLLLNAGLIISEPVEDLNRLVFSLSGVKAE